MIIKSLTLVFLIASIWKLGDCEKASVSVIDEHYANGDESEFVSIELKKRDGSEDIKLIAQIRFHLKENKVCINGQPIVHGIVNSIRMRVKIVEIENGIRKAPRLAPVTFRVLVLENLAANGKKQLILEEEFIAVEQYRVLQVEVQQLIWESSIRKPIVPIKLEDSAIHKKPHKHDRHVFVTDPYFKPRLPSHGLKGNKNGYETNPDYLLYRSNRCHHRHHHDIIRWWSCDLTFGGKIGIAFGGILLVMGAISFLIVCSMRCKTLKTLDVQPPQTEEFPTNDNNNDVKEMKDPVSGEFHMEINEGFVVEGDKKALIE